MDTKFNLNSTVVIMNFSKVKAIDISFGSTEMKFTVKNNSVWLTALRIS